eukprot:2902720-Rhodomonas_salina.1
MEASFTPTRQEHGKRPIACSSPRSLSASMAMPRPQALLNHPRQGWGGEVEGAGDARRDKEREEEGNQNLSLGLCLCLHLPLGVCLESEGKC